MIQGFFNPDSPYPWLRVGISLPDLGNRFAVVEFLIDTGAGLTCMHPQDAVSEMHLNLSDITGPQHWGELVPLAGVGGAALYYRTRATYLFLHEEMKRQTIDGSILISQFRRESQRLPSLLGWDILEQFDLITRGTSREVSLQ